MIIYQKRIYREDLKANPGVLYVFGDNVARSGYGGQAKEMRGEKNACGVSTKWTPSNWEAAYFSDSDFVRAKQIIYEDCLRIREYLETGRTVIVPLDGIGTGLSELPTRAPKIYKYICSLGLGGVNA